MCVLNVCVSTRASACLLMYWVCFLCSGQRYVKVGIRLWSGTADILPSTYWWESTTSMCPTSLNCRYTNTHRPIQSASNKFEPKHTDGLLAHLLIETVSETKLQQRTHINTNMMHTHTVLHDTTWHFLAQCWNGCGLNRTKEAQANRKRSQAFNPPTSSAVQDSMKISYSVSLLVRLLSMPVLLFSLLCSSRLFYFLSSRVMAGELW